MRKRKLFIAKIQVSLFTTEKVPQVVIYNRTRSVRYQQDLTHDMREFMAGEHKKFARCYIKDTLLHIAGEAPWQSW